MHLRLDYVLTTELNYSRRNPSLKPREAREDDDRRYVAIKLVNIAQCLDRSLSKADCHCVFVADCAVPAEGKQRGTPCSPCRRKRDTCLPDPFDGIGIGHTRGAYFDHSVVCTAPLEVLKDRMGALQLVAASVGAEILTTTIKDYIDRARPEVVTQLVEVSGLSYPSGHSLSAASLLFDRSHSCVPASSKNRASNRDSGDDGWDHTAGRNDSHLPRSALPKRSRQWHIAWGGLGAFAGRVLFVFP